MSEEKIFIAREVLGSVVDLLIDSINFLVRPDGNEDAYERSKALFESLGRALKNQRKNTLPKPHRSLMENQPLDFSKFSEAASILESDANKDRAGIDALSGQVKDVLDSYKMLDDEQAMLRKILLVYHSAGNENFLKSINKRFGPGRTNSRKVVEDEVLPRVEQTLISEFPNLSTNLIEAVMNSLALFSEEGSSFDKDFVLVKAEHVISQLLNSARPYLTHDQIDRLTQVKEQQLSDLIEISAPLARDSREKIEGDKMLISSRIDSMKEVLTLLKDHLEKQVKNRTEPRKYDLSRFRNDKDKEEKIQQNLEAWKKLKIEKIRREITRLEDLIEVLEDGGYELKSLANLKKIANKKLLSYSSLGHYVSNFRETDLWEEGEESGYRNSLNASISQIKISVKDIWEQNKVIRSIKKEFKERVLEAGGNVVYDEFPDAPAFEDDHIQEAVGLEGVEPVEPVDDDVIGNAFIEGLKRNLENKNLEDEPDLIGNNPYGFYFVGGNQGSFEGEKPTVHGSNSNSADKSASGDIFMLAGVPS